MTKLIIKFYKSRTNIVVLSAYRLKLWMILLLIFATVLWYGPATHSSIILQRISGQHDYAHAAQNAYHSVVNYFSRTDTRPKTTQQYLGTVGKTYRATKPELKYYKDATNASLKPKQSAVLTAKWSWLENATIITDAVLRFSWWTLGVVGTAVFYWRLKLRKKLRNTEAVVLIGTAALAFAVGHIFSAFNRYYNVTRLNEQTLIFISLAAVLSMAWLLRKYSLLAKRAIISGVICLSFLIAGGVIAQITGTKNPSANLNNFGTDYDRFYVQKADAIAAQWLANKYNKNSNNVIFADRYAGLRLISQGISKNILPDVTPATMAEGAYVYAYSANTIQGITTSGNNSESFSFQFPSEFINEHKNKLYSNGNAEIFR